MSFFRIKGLISSLHHTVPSKDLFIYSEMIPNKIYLEGKSRKGCDVTVWTPLVLLAAESRWTLVLVSQDGTQRPPLHFPQGGHLLAFLSCLENGLLPRGQLEPPLWSQQGKVLLLVLSSAPQGLGTDLPLLYGKVGCKITPFSPA